MVGIGCGCGGILVSISTMGGGRIIGGWRRWRSRLRTGFGGHGWNSILLRQGGSGYCDRRCCRIYGEVEDHGTRHGLGRGCAGHCSDPIGQGHTRYGRYAADRGANVWPSGLETALESASPVVEICRTRETKWAARLKGSDEQYGREVVQTVKERGPVPSIGGDYSPDGGRLHAQRCLPRA